MIIDCHGHYTTAPAAHTAWRESQRAAFEANQAPPPYPTISDDEIRETIETSQLSLMAERGIDLTIFSPRASAMGHHIGDERVSARWAVVSNDLIARVVQLHPDRFVGVCQLPQSPGVPIARSVGELRRCVEELGFVGCNLNPDPSGGDWNGPTLADSAFWPLYEALCELDVPAMIHVSATCNPHFHTTGSHYLGSDTTAFMQAMTSGLFRDFPAMRWVIPHGGGAVPYHWGRFKGMGEENAGAGWHTLDEMMANVWFDTCVYHQPGIDLLLDVVPTENVLFASEMVGSVKGLNPDTGEYYDDTRKYVDRAPLSEVQRRQVFELNVQRVYPRLKIGA